MRCVALLRALNEVRQLVGPFWGQESVPVKNIILPGLDGILSLAAALSFCRIGHPFVESKFTPLLIFPRAALDCFLECFSTSSSVWPTTNGLSDAAAPTGSFVDDGPMLVLFRRKSYLMQCYWAKKLSAGAFFRPCCDRNRLNLVYLSVNGRRFIVF